MTEEEYDLLQVGDVIVMPFATSGQFIISSKDKSGLTRISKTRDAIFLCHEMWNTKELIMHQFEVLFCWNKEVASLEEIADD